MITKSQTKHKMRQIKPLEWILSIILFLGALNYGIWGLTQLTGTGFNAIGTLFGSSANAWAYLIIGIVGIINAIIVFVDKD